MSGDRYRHQIRGTTYRVLYEAAKAQSSIVALENMTMVIYQGEADGLVWVRPALEFFDGQFVKLQPLARAPDDPGEDLYQAERAFVAAINADNAGG